MSAPAFELRDDAGGEFSTGYERQVFMFETVAITVQHFRVVAADGVELGVRVEIQRLEEEAGPGDSDAVELRIFDPLFRADLFRLATGPPGNFERAHYHPSFEGRDPVERVFDPRLTSDPAAWLLGRLSDFDGLLEAAGRAELAHTADSARVKAAASSVVEIVRQYLDSLPDLSLNDTTCDSTNAETRPVS